jgi:multidrug efflux system outer membrane protein
MPLPANCGEGGKKSNGDVATAQWWTAYRDEQLDSLVARGLEQNLDVLPAFERINAASANVTVAGAGGLPSLDVGASHTISGEMGSERTRIGATNTTGGEANVSWLVDLLGEYRRSKESALASLEAAYAAADDANLSPPGSSPSAEFCSAGVSSGRRGVSSWVFPAFIRTRCVHTPKIGLPLPKVRVVAASRRH